MGLIGIVMECLPHQAYAVKIDSSGRVSKRTRGHLRPIIAHDYFDRLDNPPFEDEEPEPPLPQAPQTPLPLPTSRRCRITVRVPSSSRHSYAGRFEGTLRDTRFTE